MEHAIASLETGAYAELQGPLNAGQISVACALTISISATVIAIGNLVIQRWRRQAKMQAMDAFKQTCEG